MLAAKGSDQELINPTYCPMLRVVLVAGRWWWTASTSTLSCATGPVQQTHIVHWKLQTGDIFFIPNMSHIPSFDMIWSQRSQFPLLNSSYRSPSVLSARCLHQARSGLSLPRAQVITIINTNIIIIRKLVFHPFIFNFDNCEEVGKKNKICGAILCSHSWLHFVSPGVTFSSQTCTPPSSSPYW